VSSHLRRSIRDPGISFLDGVELCQGKTGCSDLVTIGSFTLSLLQDTVCDF
jgi:hypothetical protein